MNFNAPFLRPVRILLFPFSLLYAVGVWIRNRLFDKNIFSSTSFNLPLIGVGNLSAGGTGKSPMVEFIVRELKSTYKVAVLSRGYKRKTAGYTIAGDNATALEIGDEPMLLHSKHPDIAVAVGEERIVAIPQLLQDRPDTDVILLDDAFQHRYIKAGLDILLTDYSNLFTRDWFLPTGDLRDLPSSYKRAHIIVVSKCPENLEVKERENIIKEIKPLDHQHVFFSTINYGIPYHLLSREPMQLDEGTEVLMVSGIANPKPLKKYLTQKCSSYDEILYSDHHIFTIDDWKEIRKRFEGMAADRKMIITTEKDAVRLIKFKNALLEYPFYVIPIETKFLFDEEKTFTGLISKFISAFVANKTKNDGTEETR
jgi:tetraacyldisaccharide 4'-kinase